MLKKKIIVFFLIVYTFLAHAQFDKVRQAFIYSKDNLQLDKARILIDAASKYPETMNDAQTWYFRGFIYKEFFEKSMRLNFNTSLAEESFNSCKKSIDLDTAAEMRENNRKIIRSLSTITNTTFNETIDTNNYQKSMDCLQLQKKLVKYLNPKSNIDSIEIYYCYNLGTYFQAAFEKNPGKNLKYLKIAEKSYNEVLILDPSNIAANYNMGIIYYNQAVSLIMNKLDYDYDLVTLNDIQDEALSWFKKSLPYMETAYQLNPGRKQTLIGLSGIYYNLYDNEKSSEFQKLSQDVSPNQK